MALEMELKTFVKSPPSVVNIAIMATAINPAIIPYSIAVTPLSAALNADTRLRIQRPIRSKPQIMTAPATVLHRFKA